MTERFTLGGKSAFRLKALFLTMNCCLRGRGWNDSKCVLTAPQRSLLLLAVVYHLCRLLPCGVRAPLSSGSAGRPVIVVRLCVVAGLCPGLCWWVRAEAATPCLPHMLLCSGTPLSWDPGLAALTLWCNVINFKSKLLFFSVLFHTNSLIPTREIQAAAKKKNGSLCPLILVDMCSF